MLVKQQKRYRRHKKVRVKIKGTAEVPRLCVFRSAKHIYAQLIDDEKAQTLIAADEKELKKVKILKEKRTEGLTGKVKRAYEIGKLIAEKAQGKKIKKVIFDRGGYKYHGRVKAVAEGAREGGLEF